MDVLFLILLIAGAVLFALAAFARTRTTDRGVDLVAAGLLCWIVVAVIQQAQSM